MPDWKNSKGYLYKVRPNQTILKMNNDYDARILFELFQNLINRDPENKPEHIPPIDSSDDFEFNFHMSKYFPWNLVARHFDAVFHSGRNRNNSFLYGWDCESTAWFDMNNSLYPLGECDVVTE